ncbi:hypothetical protein BJ684DRAFT_14271, partial [Piptocephalis cylindrospora]
TGRAFDDTILLSKEDTEEMKVKDSKRPASIASSLMVRVHSMAEALLRFLEALPEPVIPFSLYGKCISLGMKGNKVQAAEALEVLPRSHLNVFTYLVSFLREIIWSSGHADAQKLDKMASIFSAVLLRPRDPQHFYDKFATGAAKKQFLLYWLEPGDDSALEATE